MIDGTSNTAFATVSVGHYPSGVGVNPAANKICVAIGFDNTVSVIDGASNTVSATVAFGFTDFLKGDDRSILLE